MPLSFTDGPLLCYSLVDARHRIGFAAGCWNIAHPDGNDASNLWLDRSGGTRRSDGDGERESHLGHRHDVHRCADGGISLA